MLKSFRKICLIVSVLVVLFLLIGFPGTAMYESNETTRTITMYPRISTDPSSAEGYISALQTSSTSTRSVESSLLYIGSGTTYEITSQDFETEWANDKAITTGEEGIGGYQETADYDGTSDITYSYRTSSVVRNVSYEVITYGSTNGVDRAQDLDGTFEDITEENIIAGGDVRPASQGLNDTTGDNLVDLWTENDGDTYDVSAGTTMHIDTWSTSNIHGTITKVDLWVNYTLDDPQSKYGPVKNSVEFKKAGGTLYPTNITPDSNDSGRYHYVITQDVSFNSVDELNDLEVIFINDDAVPFAPAVKFDRMWLVVTVSGSEYVMNVQHDITSVPAGQTDYELWIYGNYTSGIQPEDPINVEVQNSTGGWETLGTFEGDSSPGWNVFSLTASRHLLADYVTIRYRDTVSDSVPTSISIDRVEVRAYSSGTHNLDANYTCTWNGNEADLVTLSVYDVRAGSQSVSTYIYDWDSAIWIPITANATYSVDSFTNRTYIIRSNLGNYLSGSGSGDHDIRIRYLITGSSTSVSLKVDYLGVNIHRSTGSNQKLNVEYDIQDFPGDSSSVTQIRIEDSSYISSGTGTVIVEAFNYTSNQWVSSGDPPITENTLHSHSWTFSTSPSDLLSPNPGNILVRYTFSDTNSITLSINSLSVVIAYTSEDGNGGGDGGSGNGGGGGGGGGGGTIVIKTLSAQITYPEEIEKYVPAEIDVTLIDDEGTFVSNASVTLTFGNETEPYNLEEKEGQYKLLLETDTLKSGNYTFTISAEKSGFRDFLSSAFPFMIVVKYPFATAVQYPEYWSEYTSQAVKNPISVLLDPSLYILPAIVTALITLQVTTFASIDPRKLRSIYVFTNEGQGLYYRTFFEEKGDIDSQLMSAALSGIVSLVMEATRSDKPIRTIDIETFEIFLEYGQFVTIATFVGKRIFYKRKIRRGQRKLIDNIERKYSQVLTQWDGDLSHFYELNQLVFDAFEFKLTKDLAKLIAGAAKVQLELVSLYSAQEKFHMSGRALWKAYDLYAQVKDRRAQFILERWKALEKAYLADYIGSTSVLKTRLLSQFFKLLDFIRTAGLLKILYKIRGIIYPEISKELYYFIPPEQLTERTDEGL